MKPWKITALYYGKIKSSKSLVTPGLDVNLIIEAPYIGFLLQNGNENVLVDTGIHENNIVDGKAWGALPAEGGRQMVLDALAKEGLKASDITSVIYTHLHNDHAGAAEYFKDTRTYMQKDEYINLFNQIPPQKARGDYDPNTPADILKLTDICFIDGDLELANGLKFYKLGAHTMGSQAVVVPTEKGRYVILGDLALMPCILFPQLDKLTLMDGKEVAITPAPKSMGEFIFTSLIYDSFTAFYSFNKLKALGERFEPEYYLCGHDPALIARHKIV